MRAGWGVRVAQVTVAVQLQKESLTELRWCVFPPRQKKWKDKEFSNIEKLLVPGEQGVP